MLWRGPTLIPREPRKVEVGYQQTGPLPMTANCYLKLSMISAGPKALFVVSSVHHGYPCTKNYSFQLSTVSVVDALSLGGDVGKIAGKM